VSSDSAQATMGATAEDARLELDRRCDVIEETYEFLLAYAAQGLPSDVGSSSGSQVREFLKKADAALTGIGAVFTTFVDRLGCDPVAPYAAFIRVIERDALDAQAAIQIVQAQPAISSQLVDNLNASIHVRALLTDLFLVDEILKITNNTRG
jgi:hypothetical protein